MTESYPAPIEQGEPASDSQSPRTNPWHFPPSLWVWLAILILTYVLPQVLPVEGRGAKVMKQSGITAAGLQELSQAELQTRLALVTASSAPDQTAGTKAPGKTVRADKELSAAATATKMYRKFAVEKKGVASARKVIVLEHLQNKPLDEPFLTAILARNLSEQGEKSGAIGAEIALWRSLYGKNAAHDFQKNNTDNVIGRVKTLHLGLLQQQVVSDVYFLAGRNDAAKRERDTLRNKATFEMARLAGVVLVLIGAGLAGVLFLVLMLFAATGTNWNLVRRIPASAITHASATGASALPFGGLMDVFIAYLAIARGTGLLIGSLPGLDSLSPVYLSASVYVGTGILAALYLQVRARSEHWNLSLMGLRTAGLKDILYGIAGYCAALPVTLVLGSLNNAMFKKSESSLAPNPVLPMIAGEGSEIGRIVLFCLVAIAAPIFEELFFRGVLYSALKTRFRTPFCIVISAACFAIVHPMGDWLPIFGLGCILATVREMRQSLVPGIVVHFCQNALAFAMMSSMFGN